MFSKALLRCDEIGEGGMECQDGKTRILRNIYEGMTKLH